MAKTRKQIEDTQVTLKQRLDEIITDIHNKQEAYFLTHGRYWQGLPTHSIPPKDGVETKVTRNKVKPNDQTEDWDDFGFNVANLPFNMRVDIYESEKGFGYTITVVSDIDSKLYARSTGFGPEETDKEWAELVEVEAV